MKNLQYELYTSPHTCTICSNNNIQEYRHAWCTGAHAGLTVSELTKTNLT